MLNKQASPKAADMDQKLMKKISGWASGKTSQYLKFTEKGKTDFEYLGHMSKKAGIPLETGLEYSKKLGWVDVSRNNEVEEEFTRAYQGAEFDQAWRDRVITKYL